MELKGNVVGVFLTGFVMLLLAITFTSVVANSSYDATNLYTKTNETLTFTSGKATAVNKCIESISYFGNSSNLTVASTTYVVGSSLNFTRLDSSSTGADIYINFTKSSTFNATYNYNCNYVDHGLSRTFLSLNTLWFALFVLAVALVLVMQSFPDLFNF